jgi:PLP dependent protein
MDQSALRHQLRENLSRVRERMADASRKAGRKPEDVLLVAVTKYVQAPVIVELSRLGLQHFGESRPQQLVARANEVAASFDFAGADPQLHLPQWHLIGHLQRNKVAMVLPHAGLIHSVDSLRLAKSIGETAVSRNQKVRVLLEVNVSGEASKDGYSPEGLLRELSDLQQVSGIDPAGLMTMAPIDADFNGSREVFARLRDFRDRLQTAVGATWNLAELSMGMSGDFEAGIAEGATIVRVGSALFEGIDLGS